MKSSAKHTDILWNILTVLVLLAIAAIALYFVYIFYYPESPYNTYPPPTQAAILVLPTNLPPTITKVPLTRTPVRIPSVTRTPTLTKTVTVTLTPTNTPVTPTFTPTITETFTPEVTDTARPYSAFPFMLQGAPASMSAAVFPTNHTCKWMGVAGHVVDMQDRPATGITVQLVGSLNRRYVEQTSLTGTALAYGPSGYEFTLTDTPISSIRSLSVYLLDQAGLPLSEKVTFDTFDDCTKNLVLINFKQVR
jgi:hypothetical protein